MQTLRVLPHAWMQAGTTLPVLSPLRLRRAQEATQGEDQHDEGSKDGLQVQRVAELSATIRSMIHHKKLVDRFSNWHGAKHTT